MTLHHYILALCSCGVIMNNHAQVTNPDNCDTFNYRDHRSGIFKSPGFPEDYPERTDRCYFFLANDEGGRVMIKFDLFDLEGPSDNGCQFDYIDISSIDKDGYKSPIFRYCGTKDIPMLVSPDSKLEIVFHSDLTKSKKGFLGHYEFLRKNWHPYGLSTVGCGPGYLTGVGGEVQSPNYPEPFPENTDCTWLVQVEDNHRVLLNFVSLELSKDTCTDTSVQIFDGFVKQETETAALRICERLKEISKEQKEYLSTSSRVMIRFESGPRTEQKMSGFRLVWTSVKLTRADQCDQFECSGSEACTESADQLCNRGNERYCIDPQLQCNEVPNCGAFDDSDEHKCLKAILIKAAYIGGPILGVILLIVIIVVCYCRRCKHKSNVKYSIPKDQSLVSTQSSHVPLHSMDHSPSTTRSSCVMYSTSFTDCTVPECQLDRAEKMDTCAKSNCKLNSTVNAVNSLGELRELPDDQVPPDFKTHRKRSSYHMMRELCYEDGNIVVADI